MECRRCLRDLASVPDCGGYCESCEKQNLRDRVVDLLAQRDEARAEVERLKTGISQFCVAWAPHMHDSWRDLFRELLGADTPQLGLVDNRPDRGEEGA